MEHFALENGADFTIRRPKRRNRNRTGYFALALLVTATVATGANPPQGPPPQGPSAQPQVQNASPMDYPIRLMVEAQQAFQGVRDYSCLFVKRERIQGQLGQENLIDMRVRNQPFSVYLRWMGPPTFAGQEACYVAGANNVQLRVHSTGLAGAIGFVSARHPNVRVRPITWSEAPLRQ